MSSSDWSYSWRAKLGEVVERVRSRYHHIGRKTAAPFLCVVYPPDQEVAVHQEWHAQSESLGPDFALHRIDVLEVTSQIIADNGAENIVDALEHPGPGFTPQEDLAEEFVSTLSAQILERIATSEKRSESRRRRWTCRGAAPVLHFGICAMRDRAPEILWRPVILYWFRSACRDAGYSGFLERNLVGSCTEGTCSNRPKRADRSARNP